MTAQLSSDPEGVPGPAEEGASLPVDVSTMLAQHGASLPHYYDAQRAAAARRSREDWPCIWRMAPPPG
jgi:hypothetical protein